jgi:hypothetical protein
MERRHGPAATARRIVLAVAVAGGVTLLSTAPAFAAGTGYAPPPTPTPGTSATAGAPSGFTTVLTTQTIGPAGGTLSAGGVTVTVPAGDFTVATQVSIVSGTLSALTGLPGGATPVVAIGVVFMQNGVKVTGTFPSPIKVTITNSSITAADQLYVFQNGSAVPATSDVNISGITVADGSVTFMVTADPYVAVLALASSSGVVPAATTAATGAPILTEGVLGGLLMVGGLLLAWRLRRLTASH